MGIKYFDDFEGTWIDGPKVYEVSLTQTGTNAPSIDYVYDNTIGEINWQYDSVGIYNGYLDNAFPDNKFPTINLIAGMKDDLFYYIIIERVSDGVISLITKNKDFTLTNGLLNKELIKFKVYP